MLHVHSQLGDLNTYLEINVTYLLVLHKINLWEIKPQSNCGLK